MKASVYIATSLDGFIARENGDVDWLSSGDGQSTNGEAEIGDYGYKAFMDSVDVLVMGRNTYELVLTFGEWPYGDKRVIVLSSSLTELSEDVPDTVSLSSSVPAKLVEELRAAGARHLYIDGGKTIQGFLNAGLIQEMIITRIPVLIGRGIPLFGPVEQDVHLEHLETRSFASGFVQSKYRVLS